jgi:hypothetical protein
VKEQNAVRKINPEKDNTKDKRNIFPDLSWPEGLALLPLALAALWIGLNPNFFIQPMEKTLQMKVIEKLKPPPPMTDFATQQRRLQDEIETNKKLEHKHPLPKRGGKHKSP